MVDGKLASSPGCATSELRAMQQVGLCVPGLSLLICETGVIIGRPGLSSEGDTLCIALYCS